MRPSPPAEPPAPTETAAPTEPPAPTETVAPTEPPAPIEPAVPAETQPETTPAPQGNVLYYYALQNDTLSKIAVRKGVSVETLIQMNGGLSPDAVLKDGQRIRVK